MEIQDASASSAPASASQLARRDTETSSAPEDHIFHLRDSNGFSIIAMNGGGARLRTDCMDREEVASKIIAALATAKREPVEAALELSENRFGQEMSRADEARLVRKFDRHILPIIILLYLCCFMDRINIGESGSEGTEKEGHLFDTTLWVGNARLYGLEKELGMHGQEFPLAVSCLFITYVLGITPASLLVKKVRSTATTTPRRKEKTMLTPLSHSRSSPDGLVSGSR